MAKRFDMCVARKGKGDKVYWSKIGSAWENDRGQIQLVFDALPLPDAEGRCTANLFEPKPRDEEQSQGKRQAGAGDDGWSNDSNW